MKTLTINIEDVKSEKAILDYLDQLGVNYSVDLTEKTYSWWEDQNLLNTVNTRSSNLKNGLDKGISFSDIKNSILNK
ncbi:hypothetical protein [Pedobacter mucosus]|uniref:hypothetical protein n=1 Tax=Pedobacter mucosus TaxID=2895286 RepID=UPI001EE461C8|nr:hypothetical protein [Pedobacter mucosus]UKT62620.1 hypothetical protein LOK61_12705 [Pedobacter mucosus]